VSSYGQEHNTKIKWKKRVPMLYAAIKRVPIFYAAINVTTSLFSEKFLTCVPEKSLFPAVPQNRCIKDQRKDYNTQNYYHLLKQHLEM
jgi:hypothetical protein